MKKMKMWAMAVVLFACLGLSDAYAYSVNSISTSVTIGNTFYITWSAFIGPVNIRIYKGTTPGDYITTNGASAGSIQVNTTGWEKRADYKIRVEEKANTMNFLYTNTFAVVGLKPSILLNSFSINGGAVFTQSSGVFLQFEVVPNPDDPTHYIASENSNFSGATWLIYKPSPISFTLSQAAGNKAVYFKLKNQWGESAWVWDNISYDPIRYYDISGYIRDGNGQGLNGARVSGFPNGFTTTDVNGHYIVQTIVSTWSGTITPSMSGYTFTPSSKTFDGLSGNAVQDFTAIPDIIYSWYTGPYGQCSDSCSGGKRTRVVDCRNNSGQTVADSFCTGTKPGVESLDCPSNPLFNDSLGTEQYIERP